MEEAIEHAVIGNLPLSESKKECLKTCVTVANEVDKAGLLGDKGTGYIVGFVVGCITGCVVAYSAFALQ